MAGLIDVYEYALQGVSDDNIQLSVAAFIGGKIKRNNAFRPSPAELAAHARVFQRRDDRIADMGRRIEGQKAITNDWQPSVTEEQRRAHVEAVLGRKVEHAKTANPPAMTAADRKKPKPWMKSDVLRASMARIEAQLEADGVPLHRKETDFIHVHNPEDRNPNK
jgi:hypothetical protein